MDSIVSPTVSNAHPVKLLPLSVGPALPDPHHHANPSLQGDTGLRILSSDLPPCLSLPVSSHQICLGPLPTTTVPSHQICLTALPTTNTTSSPAHQQICLAALPATTSSLAQQICLTTLSTITTQSQQRQQQQICLTALPTVSSGQLTCLQEVATLPPVTSNIACISGTDVTSLTTTSQASSVFRYSI